MSYFDNRWDNQGRMYRDRDSIPIPPRPIRLKGVCANGHIVRATLLPDQLEGTIVPCEQCGAYTMPIWTHVNAGSAQELPIEEWNKRDRVTFGTVLENVEISLTLPKELPEPKMD